MKVNQLAGATALFFQCLFLFCAVPASSAQTTPPYQFQVKPLSIPASALAFADFNQDGKQDAVGLNATGIVVYLGNGDGTFATAPVQTPAVGSSSYVFSNALIVTNTHNRNNSNPGVAFFASQYNASGAIENYGVITGDGKGDGSFGLCDIDICLPASPVYTTAPTALLLSAGDFLNNGNTDIAFAAQFPDASPGTYDDSFFVFTGDGYGDLYPVSLPQALLPAQVTATTPNPSAQAADFANNDYPDLLVNPGAAPSTGAATPGGLTLGLNNHNGTFTAGQNLLPGVMVAQFLAVDANGDKNLDIVYTETVASGSAATSIKAILGDGAGNFGSPIALVPAPNGVTGTLRFSFTDLDQDGNIDLVFSGQSSGLYWASGNGKGTFSTPALITANDTLATFGTYPVPAFLGSSTTFAWGQKAAYTIETGPQLSISPLSIDFGSQMVGSVSAPQSVSLTNVGTQMVTLSSVGGGAEFTATNGCGNSLAPGASCSVQISFAPTATGSQSGSLTLADNAPGSPQAVSLSGNGTNVTVAAATGSSLSSTITSGGTASYVLSVNPIGGFTGNLAATCIGAPQDYQCSASTANLTLSTAPVSVTFTVSPATAAAINSAPPQMADVLFLSCLLIGCFSRKITRRFVACALLVCVVGVVSGCGGAGTRRYEPVQTVATSYTLTAQFTTSTGQHISQPLTLTINAN
jgi:hypothetical protein